MLYYYARYNSSSVHLNYTLFKFILVLYTIYFIVNSYYYIFIFFFFSSRRRHTRWPRDWSSDCALPILLIRHGGGRESTAVQKQAREQRRPKDNASPTVAFESAARDGPDQIGKQNREQRHHEARALENREIGRASCRERV